MQSTLSIVNLMLKRKNNPSRQSRGRGVGRTAEHFHQNPILRLLKGIIPIRITLKPQICKLLKSA